MVLFAENNRSRKATGKFGRCLKFESLEARELLAVSQGITASELNEIKTEFSGFDYSSIQAGKVWVVEANSISSASIREAIAKAQTSSGPDMILIRTNQGLNSLTFTKASDKFSIDDSSSLILIAQGTDSLTINAADLANIFNITKRSTVQMGNMTLTRGNAVNGGAIYSEGKLVLDRMTIQNNKASADGGGVYSAAQLTVVNSVFSGNTAKRHGGGLFFTGTFTSKSNVVTSIVSSCTITGNTAGTDGKDKGGGLYFKGLDDNYEIFADLTLNNSILVNNVSSPSHDGTSAIDENIYNSLFYNELETDDGTDIFEMPVLGLIDGDYNLTTFPYWFSYYNSDHPTEVGTNQIFDSAKPLFVRDYNFNTKTEGDYSLVRSSISQAIDPGGNSKAVYPNGKAIPLDRAGNPRTLNVQVDIGAYEFVPPEIDLATGNGGQLSGEQIISGTLLTIKNITITNNDTRISPAFTLRFYASEDKTISNTDIWLGEIPIYSLDGKTSRTLDSCPLQTMSLATNQSLYFGWIIDSSLDILTDNNRGICETPLSFYNESNTQTVHLEKEEYSTPRGNDFYLALADQYSAGHEFWWSIGTGYFTQGEAAAWIDYNQYNWLPGDYSLRLKVFDPATKKVVGTASSLLSVLDVDPCIEVKSATLYNDQILKIQCNFDFIDSSTHKWKINWGDGKTTEVSGGFSSSFTFSHYYAKTNQANQYEIRLTLTDSNNPAKSSQYSITSHIVPGSGTVSAAEIPPEALPIPSDPVPVDIDTNLNVNEQEDHSELYLPLLANKKQTTANRSSLFVSSHSKPTFIPVVNTDTQTATSFVFQEESEWNGEFEQSFPWIPFALPVTIEKEKNRFFFQEESEV